MWLSWPASLDPAAVAYRVYRGQEPAYYPFQPITTTTALSYTGDLERTARYAVTTGVAGGSRRAGGCRHRQRPCGARAACGAGNPARPSPDRHSLRKTLVTAMASQQRL